MSDTNTDTHVSIEGETTVDMQIAALIRGDAVEGPVEGDKGEAVGEPTSDELDASGAINTDPESTQDIPEKDEDEDPEGDLDTDESDDENVNDIDYDLMIPMADGRDPIKLGDMKDMVGELDRSKATVDEQRMALIKQETELNQYMGAMGIQVPEGFQAHMAKQQDAHLQSQHELMMKMMPEMANKESFGAMRKDIVQVAKASNFSEKEISEVSDARIIHLLNRLAVSEAKHVKAQETVNKIKAKPGLKSVQRRQANGVSKLDKQVNYAISSNNRADKDAAIAALLG